MATSFRVALVATMLVSSSVLACTYTAKGRVYGPGRAYKFRIVNAPCPDGVAAVVVEGAPAPQAYAPPPPGGYAPVVIANAPLPPPPEDTRPSHLGIKYLGGASAAVGFDNGPQVGRFGFAHLVGLELRLSRYFALRSDYEMRPEGRSWDMVGLKVTLLPSWFLKPYLSASVAGSESYSLPGKYQLGISAAAGLDLMIGKHFFIEGEARYRVSPGVGECCREVPHLAVLVGAGVAFF